MTVRACCPLCQRPVKVFHHSGRLIYEFHASGSGRMSDGYANRCEGSGWLVEDDELIEAAP